MRRGASEPVEGLVKRESPAALTTADQSDARAKCLRLPSVSDPILHLSIPVSDLEVARWFYEDAHGCQVGRVRDDWLDVWFFGMQLTLQERPDPVLSLAGQGVRHFGVVMGGARSYVELIERLRSHNVRWVAEPTTETEAGLSGKTSAKVGDPSGNVIEIKCYENPSECFGKRG